jgi:hypothetical protein
VIYLGLAIAPWQVLAAGHIRSDAEEEERRRTGENGRTVMRGWERTEDEKKICTVLEQIASQVGTKHITAGTYHRPPLRLWEIVLLM